MSGQQTTCGIGFDEAVAAVIAGTAKAHALWVILSKESDRDGYALKPAPWEGSGEYQRVAFNDGRDVFVRIPDFHYSIDDTAKIRRRAISKATASTTDAGVAR